LSTRPAAGRTASALPLAPARPAEVPEPFGVEAGAGALRARHGSLRPGGDTEVGQEVLAAGVGLDRIRERQLERVVDHLPPGEVVPVDERDRHAAGAGPAGAPDAVQVRLLVIGAGQGDDVRDALDVDAPG